MAVAFLIGRLIFGGCFLYNGVNMLLTHPQATQYAAAKGVSISAIPQPWPYSVQTRRRLVM
jgi:hypothetical protein